MASGDLSRFGKLGSGMVLHLEHGGFLEIRPGSEGLTHLGFCTAGGEKVSVKLAPRTLDWLVGMLSLSCHPYVLPSQLAKVVDDGR